MIGGTFKALSWHGGKNLSLSSREATNGAQHRESSAESRLLNFHSHPSIRLATSHNSRF